MQKESWQRAIAESRSWTKEEAAQALAACEASGLTASAFARRHGATAGRFRYWGKRLRAAQVGDGGLVPVAIVESGRAACR